MDLTHQRKRCVPGVPFGTPRLRGCSTVVNGSRDKDYPRRGEVWMIETPHRPDDPHQPRPALIVSEDTRNRRRDSVIVVPIFSSGALGPTRVPVRAGSNGLPHDSILFGEEVAALDKMSLVDGP